MASAGEDKKISLWRKNGQNMGTIPVSGTDSRDSIEVILVEVYWFIKLEILTSLEHQIIENCVCGGLDGWYLKKKIGI